MSKSYGETRALDALDLTIRDGEFLALLGPSGCGKTTTLRLIAGLETLDSGTISVNGVNVDQVPARARNIGIVFQSYALFPHKTVFENVAYGLRRRRVNKHDLARRVSDALSRVRLDELARRYPGQLSGGQQQRVALARAVVIEPSVLLLDEPLSNLDAKLRLEMRSELRRIHREVGITTILVTHDQDEALSTADRIAVMNGGKIEQLGTPGEIYTRPRTPFVAGFIGRINSLPAQITEVASEKATSQCESVILSSTFIGTPPMPTTVGRVVVRPEHITITSAESPIEETEDTVIIGVVRQALYLGSSVEYLVGLEGGPDVWASAHVGQETFFEEGARVRVSWASSMAMFYEW